MERSIRDYQFIIYAVVFVASFTVLIIASNQLLFHNAFLDAAAFDVGDWVYWIFALSFIFTITMAYLMVKNLSDRAKFESMINSPSKSIFVRNMNDLEMLAARLGKSYKIQLDQAKEKWKVK
ncbi:DUF3198 domain-containing protein [Thermoplasma sp. Kam2015]|uniref:DUF3198 domain-containing protein n=1 Tax=Thermoplasma sp. Kam2015 TaxID=2094122 RepID=UPI000D9352C4|nr:DUF3198 domain-containing protein [Thermoplasma sp. Kam2015]PYB68654.1 DUF3198 domain-containing protein [Thermoplasma sp. Kam2015]